jgi:hypothetical protein
MARITQSVQPLFLVAWIEATSIKESPAFHKKNPVIIYDVISVILQDSGKNVRRVRKDYSSSAAIHFSRLDDPASSIFGSSS